MKKTFQRFGLFYKHPTSLPYTYSLNNYTATGTKRIELHKQFLKNIETEENNRLALLEGKTSQLISQTGIAFSLLSLFIPVFVDKIAGQHFAVRIVFLTLLSGAFLFYILTIVNAIKNYNVSNFIYSRSSPENILTNQNLSVNDFNIEEIKDLLYGANQNLKTNNEKATNLIHSYNSFKAANILTAILGILLCFVLLFVNSKKDSELQSIDNSVKIESINISETDRQANDFKAPLKIKRKKLRKVNLPCPCKPNDSINAKNN